MRLLADVPASHDTSDASVLYPMKYHLDGVATLDELGRRYDDLAADLVDYAAAGWDLAQRVDDGFVELVDADSPTEVTDPGQTPPDLGADIGGDGGHDDDVDDGDVEMIRTRWDLDGADTIGTAVATCRALSAYYRGLHERGYTVAGEDDNGYLPVARPAASRK